MNDHPDRHLNMNHDSPAGETPPPHELDDLLRSWHASHHDAAAASRDALMARIAHQQKQLHQQHAGDAALSDDTRAAMDPSHSEPHTPSVLSFPATLVMLRSIIMNRYTPAAASLMLLVTMAVLLLPNTATRAFAQGREVMMPDGGRLDAFDELGQLVGPCPLEHTDVHVDIASRFSRVTLTQRYHNPYDSKIEAVYTFPMSHRSAVDRMTMTVGDRVVVGEVKERAEARQIYESARAQGYVASLLEQERPNIFTQSIANIEPGAEVVIEISYVETLELIDGEYMFDFPMVVGPRYIPGTSTHSPAFVPGGLTPRRGAILLGPADMTLGDAGDVQTLGTLQPGKLLTLLSSAQAIDHPASHTNEWWGGEVGKAQPAVWYPFEVTYADGSKENGVLLTDGTGNINNRWFFFDINAMQTTGSGFAPDTDQVPDASRITPKPVRPDTRAGHDLSLTVAIDTGGPGIVDVKSPLHEILYEDVELREDGTPHKLAIALKGGVTIPNRDFVLSWKQAAQQIEEGHFVHTGVFGDYSGGFFTLMLQPPDRVEPDQVVPRELIFVLDTSGSMSGDPMEKSKAVVRRAIQAMRAGDTFNVITFAGNTSVLWDKPRPASEANIAQALQLVDHQQGGGGTEMMKAIDAALRQDTGDADTQRGWLMPAELADLPADGREVLVRVASRDVAEILLQDGMAPGVFTIRSGSGDPIDNTIRASVRSWMLNGGAFDQADDRTWTMRGRWDTEDGKRVFNVSHAEDEPDGPGVEPMRIVMFLTDGYVGNEEAIIQAVRANRASTRVFSFGIGNSINRFLLDGMAQAGRGEVEYVLLESEPDEAVTRFTKRIESPVLADIKLTFDGVEVIDTIPAMDDVPDLFDVRPLIIHGRYTKPGIGSLTITGRTGAGAYERTIDLNLPEQSPEHDVIATLWARARVDELTKTDDVAGITNLGIDFQLLTRHTSFVAVEKSRVTIGGEPMLVAVPIELPDGTRWEGFFGGERGWVAPDGLAVNLTQSLGWLDSVGGADQAMEAARRWHEQGGTNTALAALEAVQLAEPDNAAAVQLREGILVDYYTTQQLVQHAAEAAQLQAMREAQKQQGDGTPGENVAEITLTDEQKSAASVAAMSQLARTEALAKQLLNNQDFADARNKILTERIRLGRSKDSIAASDFERLNRRANDLIEQIDNAESLADPDGDEATRSMMVQRAADESRQRLERDRIIHENLRRIRKLQMEMKYDEALEVVDEVLFLDELNPSALVLKDVIQQNERYLEYVDLQQKKEFSDLNAQISESLIPPARNLAGPGTRGTDDILAYPEDWKQASSLRRGEAKVQPLVTGGGLALGATTRTLTRGFGRESFQRGEALGERELQLGAQLQTTESLRAFSAVDHLGVSAGSVPTAGVPALIQNNPAPDVFYGLPSLQSADNKAFLGLVTNQPTDSYGAFGFEDAQTLTFGVPVDAANGVVSLYVQPQTWNFQNELTFNYKQLQQDVARFEITDKSGVTNGRGRGGGEPGGTGGFGAGGSGGGGGSLFEDPDDPPNRMSDPSYMWMSSEKTVVTGDPAKAFREYIKAESVSARESQRIAAENPGQAGGSGGGGGGGGSLFDDPDSYVPTDPLDEQERLHQCAEAVCVFVASDEWLRHGGKSLELSADEAGKLIVRVVQDTPAARRAAADARAFIEQWSFVFDPAAPDPQDVSYGWSESPQMAAIASPVIVYDIRDLLVLSDGEDVYLLNDGTDRITSILQESIDPDGWVDYGGETGTLMHAYGRMFIKQTPENHRAIQTLLAQLRSAFGMKQDAADAQRALQAQSAAWTSRDLNTLRLLRDRQVAVRWDGLPAHEALTDLGRRIGADVQTNWDFTAVQPDHRLTVHSLPVSAGSLAEHLCTLLSDDLNPLHTVVIDGSVHLINPDEQPDVKQPTIIYDVRDILLALGEVEPISGDVLVPLYGLFDLLLEQVDPWAWRDLGGELGSLTEIQGVFIITHTPTHHRAIAQWFDQLRRSAEIKPRHTQLVGLDGSLLAEHNTVQVFHNIDDIITAAFTRAKLTSAAEQAITATTTAGQPAAKSADAAVAVQDPAAGPDSESSLFDDPDNQPYELTRGDFESTVHEQLIDTIVDTLDPESWRDLGGDVGSIRAIGGLLSVQHTADHQIRIERWLNDIRRVYGLPPRANPQLTDVRLQILLSLKESGGAQHDDASQSAPEQRIVRLTRVLHDQLWPRVFTATPGIEPLTLTVLVDAAYAASTTQSAADAIRDAGGSVEDVTSDGRIMIIKADDVALGKVAMLECVKRIEPVRE